MTLLTQCKWSSHISLTFYSLYLLYFKVIRFNLLYTVTG